MHIDTKNGFSGSTTDRNQLRTLLHEFFETFDHNTAHMTLVCGYLQKHSEFSEPEVSTFLVEENAITADNGAPIVAL